MNNLNNQTNLSREQIDSIMALYTSGQFDNAIKRIKELNEQHPNVPLLFNILGACYKAIGEIDGALQMFEVATKIKPDYAEAFFNLALIYNELNQIDNALAFYNRALEVNPKYSEAHNNLGIIYLNSKNFNKAEEHFNIAISLNNDFAEAHNNLGSTFQESNQIEKALVSYERAIALKPNYAQAQNNLGILHQKIGDNNAALLCYENAILSESSYSEAHHNLSLIKKYSEGDEQIIQMLSLTNSDKLNKSEKSRIFFALAKAHEDLNQKEDFFKFLHEGNSLRKEDLSFSYIDSEKNYNPFIKELFKEQIPANFRNKNSFSNIRPIFIVGMPRSGTSLVEQILSSHEKVYGAGELYNLTEILVPVLQDHIKDVNKKLTEEKIISIGEEYLEKLNNLNVDKKIITDKWPLNFRHIGFILSAFPQAKIINLSRNPIATCWSIYKHYFGNNGNGWSYDFDDIIKFYDAYLDLMSYWNELYPKKIYNIVYEDLTANQKRETQKLLDYCDLDWDEKCLEFHKNKRIVETASATQVRKKMYQGSSNEWKKYKEFLKPLTNHFGKN